MKNGFERTCSGSKPSKRYFPFSTDLINPLSFSLAIIVYAFSTGTFSELPPYK